MARKTNNDEAFDRAQSRQTREAADRYQRPDWGQENPKTREAYDRLIQPTGKKAGRR